MKSKTISLLITLVIYIKYASASQKHGKVSYEKQGLEFGSYMNPNPREPCEGEESQRLNACANDVLAKLDNCKADDLACECCALQSLSRDCYGLCPGSPSGSFLSVLYEDCEALNDVNACGLPFKKTNGKKGPPNIGSNRSKKHAARKNSLVNTGPDTIVKSVLGGGLKQNNRTITNVTSTANQTNSTEVKLEYDNKTGNDTKNHQGIKQFTHKIQHKIKSDGCRPKENILTAFMLFSIIFFFL